MAGGTFVKGTGKIRPGTYVNFEHAAPETQLAGERGTVLLPLFDRNFGPGESFVRLSAQNPDASFPKLGFSVYGNSVNALLIREALKNASHVTVWLPAAGVRAQVDMDFITITAKYGGTFGNKISVEVKESAVNGLYDMIVFYENAEVEVLTGVKTLQDLQNAGSEWLEFGGMMELTRVTPPTMLRNGKNNPLTETGISAFFDLCEGEPWDTLAFPYTAPQNPDAALTHDAVHALLFSKIKFLRESAGKYRTAVAANYAANYEGIINVTNGYILPGGTVLSPAMSTAWVAGANAGASYTQSITGKHVLGASGINGPKNHEDSVAAIQRGEFFFTWTESASGPAVSVEYDINSLVDPSKSSMLKKNRTLRTLDAFAQSVAVSFPPNLYDNNPLGWDVMEGVGRALLKKFADAGAIAPPDYDADFTVDKHSSAADSVIFNVALAPSDSAEKLYFTVTAS